MATTDHRRATATSPERNPVEGGELIFGTESDVATLAPGEAAQPSDKVITLGIYDPLTTYVDGKIEPYLAESIEGNDDLDEWTIDPPRGRACSTTTRRSTPTPSSSTSTACKDPATACPCKPRRSTPSRSMETPDGPEGLTVVFHLATPNVAFPDMLAGSSGYIESPTAVAGGINLKTDGVGTGPVHARRVRRR